MTKIIALLDEDELQVVINHHYAKAREATDNAEYDEAQRHRERAEFIKTRSARLTKAAIEELSEELQ